MNAVALPRLRITSGSLEALKWFALVCMVVDHTNAALFGRELGGLVTVAGRLAFPLFALVFAYNLARPRVDYLAAAKRLVLIGLVSAPFHGLLLALQGAWWPMNIMATFLVVLAVVYLVEQGRWQWATWCAIAAGCLVEYHQPGIAFAVAAWAYFRRPSMAAAVMALCGLVAVAWSNGNAYALLALPLFLVATRVDVAVPRSPWAFYLAYPLHLAVLWAITAP